MACSTAFSPAHTNMIHAAIGQLASRTNHYFAPRSVSYLELLAMTLPAEEHDEALMLPRKYGDFLSPQVFRVDLNIHSATFNTRLLFVMDATEPGAFAVRPKERQPQDTPETATFMGKLEQWVDNATRLGFVRYMFEIANETAMPGDKKYVRHLLPGVVPLLKSVGLTDVAAKLAAPARDVKTPRLEPWHRTGFVIANQIIAEALLYEPPGDAAIPSHHIATQFQHNTRTYFTVPPNEALDCPGKQCLVWPHMSL
jgi:hypothetical protein